MSSTKRLVPPPLPSTSRPKIHSDSESHNDFIKSQVKSFLNHLRSSNLLSTFNLDRILELLDNPPEGQAAKNQHGLCEKCREEIDPKSGGATERDEQIELGKRNKWFRKTLSESSLLPTLVESALNIAAGPILSDDQKEAITQLIEMNQKNLAQVLTDPKYQKSLTKSSSQGLIGTGKGIKKGWNNVGKGVEDLNRKKGIERREKKLRKEEEKILKKELKEERERFRKERQSGIGMGTSFGSSSSGKQDLVMSPTQLSMSSSNDNPAISSTSSRINSDFGSINESNQRPNLTTGLSSNVRGREQFSSIQSNSFDQDQSRDQTSIASISCRSLSSKGNLPTDPGSENTIWDESQNGLNSISTTSYSPWPGLLITNVTLVSKNGDGELRRKWREGELGGEDDDESESESESEVEEEDEDEGEGDETEVIDEEMTEDQEQRNEKSLSGKEVMNNATTATTTSSETNFNSRPLPSVPSTDQDEDSSLNHSLTPESAPRNQFEASTTSKVEEPSSTPSPNQASSKPTSFQSPYQSQASQAALNSNSVSTPSSTSNMRSRSKITSIQASQPQPQTHSQTRPPEVLPQVQDTTASKQSSKSESAAKWAGRLKTVGKGIHDMI